MLLLCCREGRRRGAGGDQTVTITLTKVKELRRVILAAKKDDSGFDFNKPGLELTFTVNAPDGKQLVRVEQPSKITASDSAGGDLTDIETGVFGRKKYVPAR